MPNQQYYIDAAADNLQQWTGATEYWVWGIDTVIPMREVDAQGRGRDRKDRMRLFRAA